MSTNYGLPRVDVPASMRILDGLTLLFFFTAIKQSDNHERAPKILVASVQFKMFVLRIYYDDVAVEIVRVCRPRISIWMNKISTLSAGGD